MKDARRQIIEKGVQAILDEHKVPYRVHTEVIKKLGLALKAHKDDIAIAKTERSLFKEVIAAHDQMMADHRRQLVEWDGVYRHLLSIKHLKGDPGEKGDMGDDAEPVDYARVEDMVRTLIPPALPGTPGKDAEFDQEKFYQDIIKRIRKEQPIDISNVRNAQTFMKNGIRYKIEELMRGAGGSASGGTSPLTEKVVAVQVGDDATIALSQLSNPISYVLFVSLDGALLMPNGNSGIPVPTWSQTGSTVTVYNADAGGLFLLQYVPA